VRALLVGGDHPAPPVIDGHEASSRTKRTRHPTHGIAPQRFARHVLQRLDRDGPVVVAGRHVEGIHAGDGRRWSTVWMSISDLRPCAERYHASDVAAAASARSTPSPCTV
jgi:hypothetical protein